MKAEEQMYDAEDQMYDAEDQERFRGSGSQAEK